MHFVSFGIRLILINCGGGVTCNFMRYDMCRKQNAESGIKLELIPFIDNQKVHDCSLFQKLIKGQLFFIY